MASQPRVEFHSGVDDSQRFACRLLRKAYGRGARVLVNAPGPVLDALDRSLWTFSANDFIPHLRLRPGRPQTEQAALTPIWLAEGDAPTPCPTVLLNLGGPMPADLMRFERIIEVLSNAPDEVHEGRERWREYAARGCPIEHHAASAP
jgi:DNA polymerase-3 subunit chi